MVVGSVKKTDRDPKDVGVKEANMQQTEDYLMVVEPGDENRTHSFKTQNHSGALQKMITA